MKCPNCGEEAIDPEGKFCGKCGTLLEDLRQEKRTVTNTVPAGNTRRTPSGEPSDDPFAPTQLDLSPPHAGPPPRSRKRVWSIVLVIVALMLIIGGFFIISHHPQNQPSKLNSNATSTANAHGKTQTANNNSTATVQAHLNATATAQAQAKATGTAKAKATATAQALPAIPPAKDCVYKYWSTGVNMQVTLTNFGVPTGCVLVSDSVKGELTREDIANSTPIDWSQGGVMAFPEGVYSGFIYNGEYEIVPKTADPNPKQVFCNRVQQVVTNHYAFSQAQPLPDWGLPPGKQIVAQGHC